VITGRLLVNHGLIGLNGKIESRLIKLLDVCRGPRKRIPHTGIGFFNSLESIHFFNKKIRYLNIQKQIAGPGGREKCIKLKRR
jgi:hypothetical protein